MKKEELKKTMIAVFDSIMLDVKAESQSNPLFDFISSNKEWIGDPEEMDIMINHKFKNVIEECVSQTYNSEDRVVCMIYTDWGFFDNNVTELTSRLEGSCCCADRGRAIVKSYIQYKITGELPVWRDSYGFPKKGTPLQWMNFIEGLANLYYGRSEKYLIALKELMLQEDVLG